MERPPAVVDLSAHRGRRCWQQHRHPSGQPRSPWRPPVRLTCTAARDFGGPRTFWPIDRSAKAARTRTAPPWPRTWWRTPPERFASRHAAGHEAGTCQPAAALPAFRS